MASELEYRLLLAKDLKMIKPQDYAELSQRAIELKRMLGALLQKLKADGSPLTQRTTQPGTAGSQGFG
jgi:23S rRNA-intervening sequence protein